MAHFKDRDINGKKLMMLTHSDLENVGVHKLGHQELILEAVDLLKSLVCLQFYASKGPFFFNHRLEFGSWCQTEV